MLPDFLCVGAPKAGTTTIHDVLVRHPGIFLPPEKELHFFDDDAKYSGGRQAYERYFSAAEEGMIKGEVTPAYMSYEQVPERIAEVIGTQVKLIFSLRDPTTRAFSEFLHNRRRGYVEGEFPDAIKWEFEAADRTQWERRRISFVSRGLYAGQVARFLRVFPREKMFFIILEEDLGPYAGETFNRMFRFLGVDGGVLPEPTVSNRGYEPRWLAVQRLVFGDNRLRRIARRAVGSLEMRRKLRQAITRVNAIGNKMPELDPGLRRDLHRRYFQDDIRVLERLIDRDLAVWRPEPD